MKKKKIILPPTYLFFCLILALAFHFFLPLVSISAPGRFLGLFLLFLGLGINIWTDNLFQEAKTTVKPYRKPVKLITKGPFRFSRHPMYLGFVLILVGIAFILGSLSSLLGAVLMFFILETRFIPLEEKRLEEEFGQRYWHYKRRINRWVGFCRS